MRQETLALPAIARAAGCVLVAGAIAAAALHFRDAASRDLKHSPQAAPDRLAAAFKRCRALAAQAKDDAACETAWAESRRRFFTDQPAPTAAAAPDVPAKSPWR